MSNMPATRFTSPLAPQIPEGFSRPEGKELVRATNREVARGIVTATRVHAAAYVAAVGVQATGMLSREAQHQSDGDPAAAARLHHIVDQFALVAAGEVAKFAY